MVIVITGPIASGKSTVARLLATELARASMRVAVIELDLLHGMLATETWTTDEARWTHARHAAAKLANAFARQGVKVIIVDGSFNAPGDRATFAEHLRPDVVPRYVTLMVSFNAALHRAEGDPTRGLSRDPAFLGPYFAAKGGVLASVPSTDLVIDTEQMPAAAAVRAIADLIALEPTS